MELFPKNPNDVSPRQALGLPEYYIERLNKNLLDNNYDLLRQSPIALVSILESKLDPLTRRFTAGVVLALIGDPRISIHEPQMIYLPGGYITLGLDFDAAEEIAKRWQHAGVHMDWIKKECPKYRANIAPFCIGKYPVTNEEYREFLDDSKLPYIPSSWIHGAFPFHYSNHPVWTVSPEAADAYATWLSRRTGRAFRLPTESEWEYAAAGEEGREFPWGKGPFIPTNANTIEAGPCRTTPVGMYPQGNTITGISDLAGNVEEYTSTTYRPYPGGISISDDLSKSRGDYRIARGGSFTRYGDLARCKRRHGWYDKSIYAMGFRLAESR